MCFFDLILDSDLTTSKQLIFASLWGSHDSTMGNQPRTPAMFCMIFQNKSIQFKNNSTIFSQGNKHENWEWTENIGFR